jgi:hypothetical protein
MELAGLEPATSWVRYRRNDVARGTFSFVEPSRLLLRYTRFAQFGSTDGRSRASSVSLGPAESVRTAIRVSALSSSVTLGLMRLAARPDELQHLHALRRSPLVEVRASTLWRAGADDRESNRNTCRCGLHH